MIRAPMTPPSSPAIQSVLDLFKGPLASVRFADIDAAGLASLAAEVESAASEVNEHEAKLTELRQGLAERQDALLVLAQRALAYARVYAENNDELLAELNLISLPRAGKPRKPSVAKANGADEAVAPSPTVEAAAVAETVVEAIDPDVPTETAPATPARASKKMQRGRLSRAFSP
jgi:hypothetical protein